MMHISVPVANTMEFINATEVSPLISKVQIKVCYVGQEANRNGTVITKEVATNLGKKVPGSPIVGYYNQEKQDFEGHNREIVVDNGKFEIVDVTKPYGFVDVGAKVWFQKFMDDGIEHEYLVTEGYLWTEIYKESKRVAEKGNNQSMELNSESEKGFWTNDEKSNKRIFIISDGLIEKLCILGQDVEPCFEGSQIKSHFSLENDPEFVNFKATMFSMISELKDTLSKGGSQETMDIENKDLTPGTEEDTSETQFEKKPDEKEKENQSKDEKPSEEKDSKSASDETKEKDDDKKKKDDFSCGEKKKQYNLEEIAEYVALQLQYTELQNKFSALEQDNSKLNAELETLRSFKLAAERKEKQAMVDSFYMLSNEDKKNVIEHLDTYSLKDIEAELSIICVRNKVNFNLDQEEQEKNSFTNQYSFNLNSNNDDPNDDVPAWVKAVREKSN